MMGFRDSIYYRKEEETITCSLDGRSSSVREMQICFW